MVNLIDRSTTKTILKSIQSHGLAGEVDHIKTFEDMEAKKDGARRFNSSFHTFSSHRQFMIL